jgi:hypothetical protein
VKDWKTGESLCYAFIEFANPKSCEVCLFVCFVLFICYLFIHLFIYLLPQEAYFKMENVLIDDKRIHVDFSQSVSKLAVGKDGRFIRNFRKIFFLCVCFVLVLLCFVCLLVSFSFILTSL